MFIDLARRGLLIAYLYFICKDKIKEFNDKSYKIGHKKMTVHFNQGNKAF